ncbi:MAG: acetylornithine deacetylase [Gammaproteobacteria bacterium]|nr:MAG: acetylornithine deacetylase [Gammaproteobacteria bacterium]
MNGVGVLKYLEQLVAFDTQNPPRSLAADAAIFGWISESLGPDFGIDMTDHGLGRVSMLAVRGEPSLLFNVHLDTVPVIEGSRFPAFELTQHEDRVYGRGACDIKGAAACLLEVAAFTHGPMAMLFTSDEEGASGCCVNEFVNAGQAEPFSQVVVAEPTDCRAVLSHRGYLSVKGQFSGVSGHSSEPRALQDNALHKLSGWVAAAVTKAAQLEREGRRPCFNVGEVQGGVKSNVIADEAKLHWSARLSPGDSNEDFLAVMSGLEHGESARWHVPFSGPPLPTSGMDVARAQAFAAKHGIEPGPVVDFWTEASLFARAGIPAIVLGPGNIAQAHAVDEWVSVEQLELALQRYTKLVNAHD